MYQAVLTERFNATHTLDGIRPDPHGHEWLVRVTLQAEVLQVPGFILNFYALKPLVQKMLPHGQYLNEAFTFAPTAENLARHFYDTLKPQLPQLVSVSVGEFEDFMCTYTP